MSKLISISPENILNEWGYVEDWTAGDSSAPTGWAMAGTAGSVAKESTIIKYGTYAMKIISGSSNSYKAITSLTNYDDYDSRTITFGMWVYCGTADKARIYIYDGTTTTNSSYHTGGGSWEFLTVTIQIGASNTELTFGCEVQSSTITAYFDGGIAVEGEDLFTDLSDYLEDWSPSMKYNYTAFKIARRDGEFIPNVKPGRKTIKIKGNVAGTSDTNTRTLYDAIVEAVNTGKKDLFLFDDRLVKGFLVGHSHKYLASLRMIKFDLDFVVPDPFLQYIARLRHQEVITSSPDSFNFSVGGSIYNFPKVTFTQSGNAMTSCTIENLTTGQSMSFTGTVADGDKLIIDCKEYTVFNDGVDSIDDFTGDFIKLVPGTNYLKFTGSDTTIDIDYHERWLL